MFLAARVKGSIQKIPEGKVFGYSDLRISKENYVTAAKALERLRKQGLIKRVSNGQYYRPKHSVFGALMPEYSELMRPFLFQNGKRVGYETGPSLYNKLGLTRQVAFRIQIASFKKYTNVNRGSLKLYFTRSYVDVTDYNFYLLGILDALKDIKRIPDCSIEQGIQKLISIIKDLSNRQKNELLNYAFLYPPRVRSLVGAIMEQIGYSIPKLEKLKNSINPLTSIKIGIELKRLPNKKRWNIE